MSTTSATPASWLLVGGADLKTVMDRLGHTLCRDGALRNRALPRRSAEVDEVLEAHCADHELADVHRPSMMLHSATEGVRWL